MTQGLEKQKIQYQNPFPWQVLVTALPQSWDPVSCKPFFIPKTLLNTKDESSLKVKRPCILLHATLANGGSAMN